MTFAERLKGYRKQAGMSQEKLAELIRVSRQAITKWETGSGIPDIENIQALSKLFSVSLDELLAGENMETKQNDFLYESRTEYDINQIKRYDIKMGGANTIIISGADSEKVKIRLASNTIPSIQSDFKINIDDVKNQIDIELQRYNGMTEATAKEGLVIFITLPQKYLSKVELEVHAKKLELNNIKWDEFEFDGKVREVEISDVIGKVEINCNLDLLINCKTIEGSVELNQLSSTSKICLPLNAEFKIRKRGIGNTISFEKNGIITEDFSDKESENIIELNGMKSELVICHSSEV